MTTQAPYQYASESPILEFDPFGLSASYIWSISHTYSYGVCEESFVGEPSGDCTIYGKFYFRINVNWDGYKARTTFVFQNLDKGKIEPQIVWGCDTLHWQPCLTYSNSVQEHTCGPLTKEEQCKFQQTYAAWNYLGKPQVLQGRFHFQWNLWDDFDPDPSTSSGLWYAPTDLSPVFGCSGKKSGANTCTFQ